MAEIPLGDILAFHGARRRADAWCFKQDDETRSWRELDAAATRRAWALKQRGVANGDMVTLALANGAAFFECAFALWKLGATPHVISPKLPRREMADILEIARPKLVLAEAREAQSDFGAVGASFGLDGRDDAMISEVSPHWKAMSSGGSTGRPKIIVDHVPGLRDPELAALNMPSGQVLLNPGPLYHSVPFVSSVNGIVRGNSIVSMAAFDPERALQLLAEHHVSWVIMVPTMMHRIWRLPGEVRARFDLSALQSVWHVSAPMPVWLKEEWINWLGAERIWELYGGSELQGLTLLNGVEWLAHKGSVGKAYQCGVRVVGEDGRDLPAGEVGEIYLLPDTGPGSTYHYVGATAKTLEGGWETLGDFGWLDADGYLYLADRRVDLILSGGRNIYPAEIEAALMEHPDVEGAVAIGLPDEDMGARPHAIVRLAPGARGRVDEKTLKAFVGERLVSYKMPRTIEFTEAQLRDDAGKVRRSALRAERIASA